MEAMIQWHGRRRRKHHGGQQKTDRLGRGKNSADVPTPGGHVPSSFQLPSRRSDLEDLRHQSLCRIVGSVHFRQWRRPSSSTLVPTSGRNCAEMSLSRPDITPPSLLIMSRKRHTKPEREKNPLTSGRLSSKPPAWTSSSDSAELFSF